MKQYKGYYIDKVIFHNEEEIDNFIKKEAVRVYKMACECFARHATIANSILVDERAERLVNQFNYTWEQIEDMEIEVFQSMA